MVASLGQVQESRLSSNSRTNTSALDSYMFGVAGVMIAAIAIRAETMAQIVATTTNELLAASQAHHYGLVVQIEQVRLPLFFGLADVASIVHT